MIEMILKYLYIITSFLGLFIFVPLLFAKNDNHKNFSYLFSNPLLFIKNTISFYIDTIKKINKSRFCLLFYFILSFLISFVFYLVFALPNTISSLNLYQPNLDNKDRKILEQQGKALANSFDNKLSFLFLITIIFCLVLYIYYLIKNKRFSLKYALAFVFIFAIIIRLFYMCYNDNIFTRQYDVYSTNFNGHYAITMHIYEYNRIPDLLLRNGTPSLAASYQFYHPKYAHYIYAYFMHFMSIFIGKNTFTLYESIRILTATFSILELFIVYKMFNLFFKNKRSILFGFLFFAFSPLLIRLTSMSNNDPCLWFFVFLSFYLTAKFINKQSYITITLLSISIGLAMGAKISGAMIAFPIGITFIYLFIKSFKNKSTFSLLLKYGVFLMIVCPIGLYWPIYNYLNYNQPLNYVWNNLNHNLLINSEHSYLSRFLYIPFKEYFKYPFMQLWASNKEISQDYNINIAMLKSSIFGEFSYFNNNLALVFAIILYVTNFIFVITITLTFGYLFFYNLIKKVNLKLNYLFLSFLLLYISLIFLFSKNIQGYIIFAILLILALASFALSLKQKEQKEYQVNYYSIFFILTIVMTFLTSFLIFNIKMPYACTMDFRYLAPIYLGGSLIIIVCNSYLNTKDKYSKNMIKISNTMALLFTITIFCFYLFIPISV